MDTMEALTKGRTTLMIAHRLSTLENCDELLVIEDGGAVIANGQRPALDVLGSSATQTSPAVGDC